MDCGTEHTTCESVGTQCVDVSVPIRLVPHVALGELAMEPVGDPGFSLRELLSAGGQRRSEIVLTQCFRIRIPVTYGAEATAEDPAICCAR